MAGLPRHKAIESDAETLEEENIHGFVFVGTVVERPVGLGHLRLRPCVLSFLEEGIRLGGHLLDFLVGKLFPDYTRLGSLLALSFLLFVGSFILALTSPQQQGDAKGNKQLFHSCDAMFISPSVKLRGTSHLIFRRKDTRRYHGFTSREISGLPEEERVNTVSL